MPTAWPVAADLTTWIGGSTSAELTAIAADVIEEATWDALARVPVKAVPSSNRPGGTNPDCPPNLRRVIIMEAAQLFAMRAPQAGFVTSDQFRDRLNRLWEPFVNWPEA